MFSDGLLPNRAGGTHADRSLWRERHGQKWTYHCVLHAPPLDVTRTAGLHGNHQQPVPSQDGVEPLSGGAARAALHQGDHRPQQGLLAPQLLEGVLKGSDATACRLILHAAEDELGHAA